MTPGIIGYTVSRLTKMFRRLQTKRGGVFVNNIAEELIFMKISWYLNDHTRNNS